MPIPIYLSVSAGGLPRARSAGYPAAQYGCRLGLDAPALYAPDPPGGRATLLLLRDKTIPSYTPDAALARMLAGYARGNYAGLVCDWPDAPFFRSLAGLLDAACAVEHVPLWLSACCADASRDSFALIGSGVTRGSFAETLAEARRRFPQRCVLDLRPLRVVFPLPCPGGGEALEPEALKALRGEGPAFFSDGLQCMYLETGPSDAPSLVLYDTRETIERKLEAAEKLGFVAAIGPLEALSQLT